MELVKFYNKKVRITDTEGRVFLGHVSDYIYPEDNEPEVESIIVDELSGDLLEFYEETIKEIEIIE